MKILFYTIKQDSLDKQRVNLNWKFLSLIEQKERNFNMFNMFILTKLFLYDLFVTSDVNI